MKRAMILGLSAVLASCSPAKNDRAASPAETLAATPAIATTTAAYAGPIPMPVLIGSDGPEMDACGTYAKVANLDPEGDNYLSVRDAPSAETKERDRLAPGQGVTVCATVNGWIGVVYAKPGDPAQDCGTGSPVASEQPYRGPCRQGWVDSRYLEMVAG